MERALGAWIDKQNQLLDWEHDEEVGQLTDRITSLSGKACQSEGLSLLNLEVDSTRTVLFGRCCISLQRTDKQQIVQSFKVGDEVSLYNPKLAAGSGKANEDAILLGLVGKVSQFKVEMIVDEFDDHLFEPPLRMDLRSSMKTHTTMKEALTMLQHEGMSNPLVNLLFNPDMSSSSLLTPQRNTTQLEASNLWNQNLNESQVRAIQCALDAPTVAIIHGPPGTGKTSTLTELILQAASRDMKILVCAPSNIAVDTILGRLADCQTAMNAGSGRAGKASTGAAGNKASTFKCALNMVRVGHPARISAKIMKYALDSIISNDEATEIVKDVRKDIDTLRCEMSKKGKKKWVSKEDGGVSLGQLRREQRTELRSLCKEARQRERAVVATILRRANIVLSTCIGAGSRLLRELDFDLVVIDEAAQGLEAACWIPILKLNAQQGGKCVLAGDHCQLPPTIKSSQAEKGGLSVTLFERIIKDTRFQQVVRLLDTQYRMNRRISDWASHNMYHDAIRSHPSVAEHTLRDILPRKDGSLPPRSAGVDANVENLSSDGYDESDLDGESSPVPAPAVPAEVPISDEVEEEMFPVLLLVDSSGLGMYEDSSMETGGGAGGSAAGPAKKASASHRNFHEAELVRQHVLALVRAGVKPSQIGVITPYNGQLEVLRELLFPSSDAASQEKEEGGDKSKNKLLPVKSKRAKVHNPLVDGAEDAWIGDVNLEGLEIKTIDGFQGGEKECILLSLVRSNASHTVGFLGERRRINVAVTRAKRHLAVFCDADTCSVDAFMGTLIDHMSSEGDHISAQEYLDLVASGGYSAAHGGETFGSGPATLARSSKPVVEVNKELKKLTSTIEKADFMRVLEKLKAGSLIPADSSKNAVVILTVPEAPPTNAADGERETVTARLYCQTGVLRFPPSMNSYLRMVVHECAETLGLQHRSVGEDRDRCIEVCAAEFPAVEDALLMGAKKSKKDKKTEAYGTSGQAVSSKVAPVPALSVPAATPPSRQSSPVPADSIPTRAEVAVLPLPLETPVLKSAPKPEAKKKSTPAAKKTAAQSQQQQQAYMGADRRSALGRLEAQHEQEMKAQALDEDALLEAAIQHNQRVAQLHQYRVTGAGAMPNPDKVAAREKLQSRVAEAALARARGSAGGDSSSAPSTTGSAGGGAGYGYGVGRVGGAGNVFGFAGIGGSTGGGDGETAKKTSGGGTTGSSGGGGKKKVLKKPPPNFGGGVLGSK